MTHKFVKMHGLGNDFVILDTRSNPFMPTAAQVRHLSDRRYGVGCDQLIVLSKSDDPAVDAFMHIFNADGGEVEACGNATRCVGSLLTLESKRQAQVLKTKVGILSTTTQNGETLVDMGIPSQDWQVIGLSKQVDTLYLPVHVTDLDAPAAVSVGNPHMVFFVNDIMTVDIERFGHELSRHPLYLQGTNVEIVEILSPSHIRMRVWERGTGVTPACATGACASVVAGTARGHLTQGQECEVTLDGGTLHVRYDGTHVFMRGPVRLVYEGRFDASLIESHA